MGSKIKKSGLIQVTSEYDASDGHVSKPNTRSHKLNNLNQSLGVISGNDTSTPVKADHNPLEKRVSSEIFTPERQRSSKGEESSHLTKYTNQVGRRDVSEEEIREFAEKINKLYHSLLSYAVSLTRNAVVAEDLLSESIIKALKNYQNYDERNSLKSYMNTIIHNTFINNYHREQREIEYTKSLMEPMYSEIRCEYETLELLSALEPETRKALYLCDVLGYKYKEIADILQIPQGTVMSKVSRGRAKLRQIIKA